MVFITFIRFSLFSSATLAEVESSHAFRKPASSFNVVSSRQRIASLLPVLLAAVVVVGRFVYVV